MYWYYKVPLIIILILILSGLCYVGWRSWTPATRPAPETPQVVEEEKKQPERQPPQAPVVPEAKVKPEKEVSHPLPPPEIPGENEPKTVEKKEDDKPAETLPPAPVPKAITEEPKEPALPRGVAVAPNTGDAAGNQQVRELLDQARSQLKAGSLLAARTLALKALAVPGVIEYGKMWRELVEIVNQVNTVFMNSAAPCPEKLRYVIQPGDNLSRIARLKHTTVTALQRMNELSRTKSIIHPGNSLLYIEGTWSIKVSKSQFLLSLYLNDKLFKVYKVGVGRQDRTPVGVFEILSKSMRPAWAPPGQESKPYGHPENIIGSRWMGLKAIEDTDPGLRGYGIHGTVEPESVGTPSSAGCIRLRNEDVEELFDFIPEPMQAKVRVVINE